jgi:hypothetical protein
MKASANQKLNTIHRQILATMFCLCGASMAVAQTCTPISASGTYRGVSVTVNPTATSIEATDWTSCGVTSPVNSFMAGSSVASTIAYSFSAPQTSLRFVITAASFGESASFSLDAGTPTLSVNASSCPPAISGGNATFDIANPDEGADLQVTGSQPFQDISVDVPVVGAGSGVLLALCAESITSTAAVAQPVPSMTQWATGGLAMALTLLGVSRLRRRQA